MEGDCIDEANLQMGPLRTWVRGFLEVLAMAGGVAKNRGVVKAIEEELGEDLIVPSEPQIVGALGAALLAMEDLGATTR